MIEFSHHIRFFLKLNLPHDPRTVVPQVTFLTPEADNDESGFFLYPCSCSQWKIHYLGNLWAICWFLVLDQQVQGPWGKWGDTKNLQELNDG